jgi:hypothetical protein
MGFAHEIFRDGTVAEEIKRKRKRRKIRYEKQEKWRKAAITRYLPFSTG